MSDTLATGRSFRTLNVVNEHTWERLAIEVDTSLMGERVGSELDQVIARRGKPHGVAVDNEPESTGRALGAWAYRNCVQLHFIRQGRPVENCLIESFNGSIRDECFNQHWFTSLDDARRAIQAWRHDYNHFGSHSPLGYLAPKQFAEEAAVRSVVEFLAPPRTISTMAEAQITAARR